MTALHQQSEIPGSDVPKMTSTPVEIDWKQRYEQLQYEHQLELERTRLHYDHELKEKVAEIRTRLKQEYDQHFEEFRNRIFEEQRLHNVSSGSLYLDQSIGEQVREQVRIAEEYDHYEDEQRRQLLSQPSPDNDEFQRIVNKLHTEGVHVLSLSEILSLRANGINLKPTEGATDTIQKLREENSYLRSLIANMNANEKSNTLIKCLTNIFRCEQERRLMDIRHHNNIDKLQQDIDNMCEYQRKALGKLLSQDRIILINELEQTKQQLQYLKENFEQLKQNQSKKMNSQNLNKFYAKYLRCEAYRKALVYQKRYLLILLTGYEDTEAFALKEIQRLQSTFKSHGFSNDQITSMFQYKYNKRSTNYRFRFRCYVIVAIGMIRMQWLVKKWVKKVASLQ